MRLGFGWKTVLGLIVAAVSHGTPALAIAPGSTRTVRATGFDLLRLADRMAAQGDNAQSERIYTLLANDPDPDLRNEARFRLAKLRLSAGETQAAALLLREILDEKPSAAAARLQLAQILYGMGDEDAALRELRALRSASLPPGVAQFVDRMSATLQANKPLGFQLEFGLAPDSNINRATRSDTLGTVLGDFTLDEDAKARSGVGAMVRGLAQARFPLSDSIGLSARASGEANIYRDKDFNDITLDLSAGPQLRLGRTRLTAEAGVTGQWYGMEAYQRAWRLSLGGTQPIGSRSQLRVDATARWVDNKFNNLQDGHGRSVRARLERALSPRLLVAGSLGLDRYKAEDDAYSTRSWTAGLSAYRDIGRITVNAGVDFGRLRSDERLALLPESRKDRWARFQLGAVFRNLTVAGFAPVVRLVVERNQSTVEYYDYKRTRTEFGISRAF